MIHIASPTNDINSFFKILENELGGTRSTSEKEQVLELDNTLGKGQIRALNLEDGISVLELHLTVKEDIEITLDSPLSTHVNFVYCSKGKLSHRFSKEMAFNSIETFQTSIISNIVSKQNTIILKKDVETTATIITVDTAYNGTNTSLWNIGMRELFIKGKTHDYLYVGTFNLKITESIKQLQSIKQEGLVRELLTKGIVNVILALEIDHYNNDITNMDLNTLSLTKKEIRAIEVLTDYINEFPELDLKVENLSDRVGVSSVKLQEGFKFKHNVTICEYIRNVRLTKSEELISSTDMNISEIVYSIGFTSRSYFSKIFKERFDLTPSDYKKNKLAVSA